MSLLTSFSDAILFIAFIILHDTLSDSVLVAKDRRAYILEQNAFVPKISCSWVFICT